MRGAAWRRAGPAIALLLASGGCLLPSSKINLPASVDLPEAAAVLFFPDGLDRERMAEMVGHGRLPHIERHFVQGGVAVSQAVTSLPSITYPNAAALITGRYPGHHNILGNQWFDRRTLQSQDYLRVGSYRTVNQHLRVMTLFEALHDEYTVSIQAHTRRGASDAFDNFITTGLNWYTGMYSGVDAYVGRTFPYVVDLARRRKRWPTVLLNYYPGLDETGHHYGSDSPEYARALEVVDGAIGLVCDAIRAHPILGPRTYFVLITDHGHLPVQRIDAFDLHGWLEDRGLNVFEGILPQSSAARLARLRDIDVVMISGDSRCALLHLRGPGGWAEPAAAADIEKLLAGGLLDEPAVDMAVVRAGADAVRVRGRAGELVVRRLRLDGDRLYRLESVHGDLLGYQDDPRLAAFVAAGWHDSRAWLKATADTRYPDFVAQIVDMLDSSRSGDIVLFAAERFLFGDSWAGAHGSCGAYDMLIPMYFAGPGLPPGGRIDHARLVDVTPTVLDLLGHADRIRDLGSIDGISLADALRQARPAENVPPAPQAAAGR